MPLTSGSILQGLRRRKKQISLTLAVFFTNLAVDRAGKYLALRFLRGRGAVRLLRDSVMLYFTENTGAFLSMGAHWSLPVKRMVLLYLPLLFCAALLLHLLFRERLGSRIIVLAAIAGGGVSNLLDRILNDFRVIDFLYFGIGPLHTGILNPADLSVTLGAALLLILELRLSFKALKRPVARRPALQRPAVRQTRDSGGDD
ncbi:MAG: signal peptidase II [Spirochaetaceae bacterium]|jgi:signal peptidase II|nr:signal peptidase II [Spirochaetaceae bacterium]